MLDSIDTSMRGRFDLGSLDASKDRLDKLLTASLTCGNSRRLHLLVGVHPVIGLILWYIYYVNLRLLLLLNLLLRQDLKLESVNLEVFLTVCHFQLLNWLL